MKITEANTLEERNETGAQPPLIRKNVSSIILYQVFYRAMII